VWGRTPWHASTAGIQENLGVEFMGRAAGLPASDLRASRQLPLTSRFAVRHKVLQAREPHTVADYLVGIHVFRQNVLSDNSCSTAQGGSRRPSAAAEVPGTRNVATITTADTTRSPRASSADLSMPICHSSRLLGRHAGHARLQTVPITPSPRWRSRSPQHSGAAWPGCSNRPLPADAARPPSAPSTSPSGDGSRARSSPTGQFPHRELAPGR